jgi:hypothetical protein
MKNYFAILSISLLSIFFASCKKSGTEQVYSFKTKIDGNWVTYANAKFTIAPNSSDSSLTDLLITAGTELSNINIYMSSATNYVAGDYNTTSTSPYIMQLSLFKEENNYLKVFGTTGPGTGTDPYYIVHITSVTPTEIRGTITGNYLYDGYDAESINLTEGEFVAVKTQ